MESKQHLEKGKIPVNEIDSILEVLYPVDGINRRDYVKPIGSHPNKITRQSALPIHWY